jgi:hypothetical protein
MVVPEDGAEVFVPRRLAQKRCLRRGWEFSLISIASDALIDPSLTNRNGLNIMITTALENDKCTVVIDDNGSALRKRICLKLFEPFFSTKVPYRFLSGAVRPLRPESNALSAFVAPL